MINAMSTIEEVLGHPPQAYLLRPPDPGDLGGRSPFGVRDSPSRSCWTAVGTVKPVGPTLTQDQRPSLTTGTPALAMLSTRSPAR